MYVWYANDIHVYIVDSKIGCENVIVLIFRLGGGGQIIGTCTSFV